MLKRTGKARAADILILIGAAVNLAVIAGMVVLYLLSWRGAPWLLYP